MASFNYLIFVSLAILSVYSVVAEEAAPKPEQQPQVADEAARVKKHAYVAAPGPVLAYSAAAPAAYPYAYSAYPAAYPYAYPSAYPYAAPAYTAYPSYAYDDGKYWPGKYEKTFYPSAYKAAYPTVYHY